MKRGRELFHRFTEEDSIYSPENFIKYLRDRFPNSERLPKSSVRMNGTKYTFYRLVFPEFESIIEIEESTENFENERTQNTRIILRDESHSRSPNPLRDVIKEAELEQKTTETL